MTRRTILGSALTALALLMASTTTASAQVVEAREGASNPAEVLFRSTLFGAATGLALGGAYALVADDADTGEVLRWSTAGGAAGGLLIGLVYMVTRSDPEGSLDEGAVQLDDNGLRLSVIGALPEKRRDMAGVRGTAYDVKLFRFGM
jgi:hypothetical protein